MTELERLITVISLINSALFYVIIILVFIVADKTRLNSALATQKAVWLLLITFVALPAYIALLPAFPGWVRMTCWVILAVSTWWVLIEVYRVNRFAVKQWVCDRWLLRKIAQRRGRC